MGFGIGKGAAHPLCKAAAASWLVVQLLFLNVKCTCVSVRRLGWPAAHLCRSLPMALCCPDEKYLAALHLQCEPKSDENPL